MSTENDILFEDSVAYEGIPSHLHTYWRSLHIKHRCPKCGAKQTLKNALAQGYNCVGHPCGPAPHSPFKGSAQHACCGIDARWRGPWSVSGCTRMMCRIPPQRSLIPPFIAVPARLVASGDLEIHKDMLATATCVETAKDAGHEMLFYFDYLDYVVPFMPQDIIDRDEIKPPQTAFTALVQSTNIFEYIDLIVEPEPRSQMEIETDPTNTHLQIQNNFVEPFEPVLILSLFDNTFEKSRITATRLHLAAWRYDAGAIL